MKKKRYFLSLLLILSTLLFNVGNATTQTMKNQEDNKRLICIVKKGDSLWKIAKRHNINFQKVVNTNHHFKDSDLIYPGDKVYNPKKSDMDMQQDMNQNRKENMREDTTNKEPSTMNIQSMENKVVQLVNQERQKRGLKAYQHNPKLSQVAKTKAEDMRDNNYFSHTSPTYGSPFEMLEQFNVQFSAAGENIAKGQKTPQEVMNAWMNSSGHRKNILSNNYTHIGIGLAKDEKGMTYWVQMFIRG